jgi:hypothetical protein
MFSRTEMPTALPGQCYCCGSGTKSYYLDLGVSIEFYGAVFFCNECFSAMAACMGFVHGDKTQDIVRLNNALHERVLELEIKNNALAEAIQNLSVANFGHENLMVVLDGNRSSDIKSLFGPQLLGVLETSDDDISETREGTSLLDDGEGETSESSEHEPLAGLRPDESGNEDFSFTL